MMSEKRFTPSPVERLQGDFAAAVRELNTIESDRNLAMRDWADMRQALEGPRPQVELTHRFQTQTTIMRELNERYVLAQQRVRAIRNAMAQGHAQWSKERLMDSRSHAA